MKHTAHAQRKKVVSKMLMFSVDGEESGVAKIINICFNGTNDDNHTKTPPHT